MERDEINHFIRSLIRSGFVASLSVARRCDVDDWDPSWAVVISQTRELHPQMLRNLEQAGTGHGFEKPS